MADSAEEIWVENRRRVLDIAYRMLGSRVDAEDIVQEVYLRLSGSRIHDIDDPTAWLVTVTSRMCIDRLRTVRSRRESYVGPWLPEPLVGDAQPVDPADRVTLDESVRIAMLVVLEQLSPSERAVFILHDVFRTPFEEIAAIVGRSDAACRQLASRARRRVAAARPARFEPTPEEARAVVAEFALACETGDLDRLVAVLDPAVEGWFDSGGHIAGAPTGPVTGSLEVAAILTAAFSGTNVRVRPVEINGGPGVRVVLDGRTASVIALAVGDGVVTRIHGVGNPAKLTM